MEIEGIVPGRRSGIRDCPSSTCRSGCRRCHPPLSTPQLLKLYMWLLEWGTAERDFVDATPEVNEVMKVQWNASTVKDCQVMGVHSNGDVQIRVPPRPSSSQQKAGLMDQKGQENATRHRLAKGDLPARLFREPPQFPQSWSEAIAQDLGLFSAAELRYYRLSLIRGLKHASRHDTTTRSRKRKRGEVKPRATLLPILPPKSPRRLHKGGRPQPPTPSAASSSSARGTPASAIHGADATRSSAAATAPCDGGGAAGLGGAGSGSSGFCLGEQGLIGGEESDDEVDECDVEGAALVLASLSSLSTVGGGVASSAAATPAAGTRAGLGAGGRRRGSNDGSTSSSSAPWSRQVRRVSFSGVGGGGRAGPGAWGADGADEDPLYQQLLTPLPEEHQQEVAAVWDEARQGGAEENLDVAVELPAGASGSTVAVLGKHMFRMRPGEWLYDEAINMYMWLLQGRDAHRVLLANERGDSKKPSHFFNSFFFEKLLSEGLPNYELVKRFANKITSTKGNVFKLDKIFAPVNVGGTHWCMLVAYVQQRRIQYYDSFGGSGEQYLDAMKVFLENEATKWVDDGSVPQHLLDLNAWALVRTQRATTPQQNNCCDCGVFSCTFANYISQDLELNFSCDNMLHFRQQITYDILHWDGSSGSALALSSATAQSAEEFICRARSSKRQRQGASSFSFCSSSSRG